MATVTPLSPCRRCRRGDHRASPASWPPLVDKKDPSSCSLSLPPSFLSFPRNPNPSSPRFRPPPAALNRRRPGPRRAPLACPTAPPRRHSHPHTRNWRGKPGFVASIRASASPSAAAVVMVAVVPANPWPSRAHLRRRRVLCFLPTGGIEPGGPTSTWASSTSSTLAAGRRSKYRPIPAAPTTPALAVLPNTLPVSSCLSWPSPPPLPLPGTASHRTPPPAAAPATTPAGSGDQMVNAAAPGIHSTSST